MKLKDRNVLAALMVIHNVSARQLAGIAGWKSHSHMNRLLSGEATSVRPAAAALIANRLRVPVSDLFVPSASSATQQTAQRQGAA